MIDFLASKILLVIGKYSRSHMIFIFVIVIIY